MPARNLNDRSPSSRRFPSIVWCGIDYGETIMNPLALHQSRVIREIYSELGRADEAEERVRRWYRLRGAMGPPSVATHLLVRDLKQYARDRIYTEVLDGDRYAVELFEAKEVAGIAMAEGVDTALARLQRKGVAAAIVSESASRAAAETVARYLRAHALSQYFQDLITPAGRFSVDGHLLDRTFVGATKKAGSLYGRIRQHLDAKGIPSSSAAIIGDDPLLDVEQAAPCGFVTIQYVGVIDRGVSETADYVLTDWRELERIV